MSCLSAFVGATNLGGPVSSPTCAQGSRFARCPSVWSCATDLPQSLPGGARGGLLLSVPGGGPCPCLLLYIVPTVIDCLFRALGPSDYVLTVCHFGPLSVAVSPSERCVSCCVLGGSIGRVVDFWPSLPFWSFASRPVLQCVLRLIVRLLQSSPFGSPF